MATSWEELVNLALRKIKATKRVGSAYEGSAASEAALQLFSQVRDNLIQSADWDFTRRANVPLTIYKGPPPAYGFGPWQPWTPAYPPPPWIFEYAYPSDCVQFSALVPMPTIYPILDPQPANWRVDEDAFDASGQPISPVKVIMARLPMALGVYQARITNMALWDSKFTEAFVDALAAALEANPQLKQVEMQRADMSARAAELRLRG